MSKALVVGGTGFLGRALCIHLHRQGWEVSSYSRRLPEKIDQAPGIRYVAAFETENEALEDEISKNEVVFNLANANIPALSNNEIMEDINRTVGLNIRLLQMCVKHKIRNYIFASSGGTVYGPAENFPIQEQSATNPLVAYGINKLVCEKYIGLFHHNYGLNYTILRIANPFGPGQSPFTGQGIIAKYLHASLSESDFVIFGDGSSTRDYIYVDDVSRAFECVVKYEGPHKIFNVGLGHGLSINELMECANRILDRKPAIKYVGQRTIDVGKNYLDVSLIGRECGWEPLHSIEEGLAKTLEWMRHRYFMPFSPSSSRD